MAYLKKRDKNYYVRYHYMIDGKRKTITKSLQTRHKDVAQKMIRELERKEELGEINPLDPNFNPAGIFKKELPEQTCKTVEVALELFYQAKAHRSPKTIEAYKWALEIFFKSDSKSKKSGAHHCVKPRRRHKPGK